MTVREVDPINLETDNTTGAIATITYPHKELHAGEMFRFRYIDEDIDINETKEWLITTPNTAKWFHFEWLVTSSLKGKAELFEDSTRTTTDTAETIYNANRNSTDSATLTIQTHSTTDGADGTRIDVASWGAAATGGSGLGGLGGEAREQIEWILKQNAAYLFKFTSGADDNNITIGFGGYEHTNLTTL